MLVTYFPFCPLAKKKKKLFLPLSLKKKTNTNFEKFLICKYFIRISRFIEFKEYTHTFQKEFKLWRGMLRDCMMATRLLVRPAQKVFVQYKLTDHNRPQGALPERLEFESRPCDRNLPGVSPLCLSPAPSFRSASWDQWYQHPLD